VFGESLLIKDTTLQFLKLLKLFNQINNQNA